MHAGHEMKGSTVDSSTCTHIPSELEARVGLLSRETKTATETFSPTLTCQQANKETQTSLQPPLISAAASIYSQTQCEFEQLEQSNGR